MQLSDVDFRDIQGLVRFGYGHLHEARFYLLQITDAAQASAWIKDHIDDVTTAVPDRQAPRALQIAFTCEGLGKLGIAPSVLKQFSLEFRGGMADPNRSRRLGDVDANRPACWDWGGMADPNRSRRLGDVDANRPACWDWGAPGEDSRKARNETGTQRVPGDCKDNRDNRCPDVLVLMYGTEGAFKHWDTQIRRSRWADAFREIYALSTIRKDDLEPFGFVDGVSQPMLDWSRRKPIRLQDTTEYTNLSALGEFLLGYPNEYGHYTDRPLLDADDQRARVLPLAEDEPGKRDFGRNGTYLVLRDLRQNVSAFREFVEERSGHDKEKAHALLGAMSGRVPADQKIIPPWPKRARGPPPWHAPGAVDDPKRVIPPGGPVNPLSESAIDGVGSKMKDIWLDQFTFDNDPDGTSCPYGAHIRRSNPRNADLPAGTRGRIRKLLRTLGFDRRHTHGDLLSSTRFHRIVRRGRAYHETTEPDGERRGLRFIALNANISRQFEFIQASWLVSSKFNGLDEDDPLVGGRTKLMTGACIDRFTRPQDSGLECRLHDIPQFVTVRGGAYFFMPGLSALRYIAGDEGGS